MDAALALLQNARAELEAAVPNKGGHRERAIELVDRAIVQVREGIAFAATHDARRLCRSPSVISGELGAQRGPINLVQ